MSFYKETAGDTSFRRTWSAAEKPVKKAAPIVDEVVGPDAPKPLVQARKERIDFASKVNKTQLVHSVKEAGFNCAVCKRTFKDSAGYLDHINSRQHLLAAGLSLRIEKSTVEQVKDRIAYWIKKTETGDSNEEYDLQARVDKALQEEKEVAAKRKEKELVRKQHKKEVEAQQKAEFEDDEVAAMMGFGGFKSTK